MVIVVLATGLLGGAIVIEVRFFGGVGREAGGLVEGRLEGAGGFQGGLEGAGGFCALGAWVGVGRRGGRLEGAKGEGVVWFGVGAIGGLGGEVLVAEEVR